MRKGFTLIELLVVIAIIGILSTLATAGVFIVRERARDSKRVADVRNLQTALELYNNEVQGYPSTATSTALGSGAFKALCAGGWKASCDSGETPFMGLVPVAPMPPDGTCTAAQNDYSYYAPPGGLYTLTFCLGHATGYLSAGPHVADQSGIR